MLLGRALLLLLVLLSLICVMCLPLSCGGEGGPMEEVLLFPTQEIGEAPRAVMSALLTGRLLQDGNYLRIEAHEDHTRYLVIWPPGYGFRIVRGQAEVVDEQGKTRLRVGEEVFVSGGETDTVSGIAAISPEWQKTLSKLILGPYWIVGAEIRSLAAHLPNTDGLTKIDRKPEEQAYYDRLQKVLPRWFALQEKHRSLWAPYRTADGYLNTVHINSLPSTQRNALSEREHAINRELDTVMRQLALEFPEAVLINTQGKPSGIDFDRFRDRTGGDIPVQ